VTDVDGLAQFQRRWGAIPAKVRATVQDTLGAIAEGLVQEMRAVAPADTGKGRASINWTWGSAPAGAHVLGHVAAGPDTRLRITIYAAGGDEFYMWFQEFGTVNMPANPFFYPVWRARRRSARSRVTRSINRAIRRA